MKDAKEWDLKFMDAARHFGTWSKCLSRKIGAILVRDKTIISTGYNGPPRGVPHCDEARRIDEIKKILESRGGSHKIDNTIEWLMKHRGNCPRKILGASSGEMLYLCQAGHAERNAIVNAAREGVVTKGADLYCYSPLPCLECAKSIINAGIKRVFYLNENYDSMAGWLFMYAGVNTTPILKTAVKDIT